MIPGTVYLLPPPHRAQLYRRFYRERNTPLVPAIGQVLREAELLLDAPPPSVTDKPGVPPSGDKRDYMSLGTYWWPNPETPNGLPYIRRDGHRNPEIDAWDVGRLHAMAHGVKTLALAYGLSGQDTFAARAALYLRTWFLDERTRMNPHLEYGQAIPGSVTGRGIGIIDSRHLCGLMTAAAYLHESPNWSEADSAQVRAWYTEYLQWLLESEHGIDEARQHNNHGTWYDVQVVNFAQSCGAVEEAVRVLKAVPERRIFPQIAADGSQPHELARTLSANYCIMNLSGFALLAQAGSELGVDLWNAAGPEGQSLRAALEWMIPFAHHPETWSYPQIKAPDWSALAYPLMLAARAYNDPKFDQAARAISGEEGRRHRVHLMV